MQEHPVPQNVTGYEFHLIGQMTLKQFMEVAAGIIIAVIVNTTNLPTFIKYPVMFIAGVSGAALAFIPFEGRPLDRWFLAFIKAIYQPTMFFWKKSNTIPEAFTYVSTVQVTSQIEIDYKPIRQSRVKDYISSITTTQASKDLSEEEQRAQEVLLLFSQPQHAIPVAAPIPQGITTPGPGQTQIIVAKQASDVSIPESVPTKIENASGVTPIGNYQTQTLSSNQASPMQEVFSKDTHTKSSPVAAVATDASLPFPNKPTVPNMIVGMVVTPDKKIIENAIVTIYKKADRTPIRALKTNALGQFGVITPLENGEYIIEAEKEGFHFTENLLTLSATIIDPLLLQAHS